MWPLVVRAQQTPRQITVVGVLWHAANAEEEGVYLHVLRKAFNELGYIEGKNIVLEHRFPAEHSRGGASGDVDAEGSERAARRRRDPGHEGRIDLRQTAPNQRPLIRFIRKLRAGARYDHQLPEVVDDC